MHPSSPASPNECTAVVFGHSPFGLGHESHLRSIWLHFAAFPQLHDVTSLPFPSMSCSEDAAAPPLKVHPKLHRASHCSPTNQAHRTTAGSPLQHPVPTASKPCTQVSVSTSNFPKHSTEIFAPYQRVCCPTCHVPFYLPH